MRQQCGWAEAHPFYFAGFNQPIFEAGRNTLAISLNASYYSLDELFPRERWGEPRKGE